MPHLVIEPHRNRTDCHCALCGETTKSHVGPHLALADSLEPVCPRCGKRQAPALAALLELAGAAERVGKIRRHTVFPPVHALLDLARAAEDYLHFTAPAYRKAG